jgi:DNA-binding Lrp family transcriptional regulator
VLVRATVICATGGGQRGMLSAYVLIQTEVGKAGQVAQAIGGIDGVQRAEDVAGPYDVIARVQAPGMDELGRLVVARIQAVDGVTRTLTCTMIRR